MKHQQVIWKQIKWTTASVTDCTLCLSNSEHNPTGKIKQKSSPNILKLNGCILMRFHRQSTPTGGHIHTRVCRLRSIIPPLDSVFTYTVFLCLHVRKKHDLNCKSFIIYNLCKRVFQKWCLKTTKVRPVLSDSAGLRHLSHASTESSYARSLREGIYAEWSLQ